MKTGIWIGTVKEDYGDAHIPMDDTLGAMSVALFKVSDGLNEWYTPEESSGIANGVYRTQGIDFMPHGNGRGKSLDQARQEGINAGLHAAATGSEFILDLEPDPDLYWAGIPGTPHAYCEGYTSTSHGIRLRLNPDARNPGINLEEWVKEPIVGIWHPQMYAASYGESQAYWERLGIKPLLDLGVLKSHIYPMLSVHVNADGNPALSPDALQSSIRYYVERDYAGFCLFRRRDMDGKQVERLLSMEDPWHPGPPPTPPVDEVVLRSQVIINQATEIIALRTGGK